MDTTTHSARLLRKVAVGAVAAAAMLLAPAAGLASGGPVTAPAIPGVAGLPGPIAANATPAPNIGILKTAPDTGFAGTNFTLSGSGLPANKPVSITWSSANVTWLLDARPDSVDYLGRVTSKLAVVLATAQTDSTGSF